MKLIADDPIVACALRTGYPPWELRPAAAGGRGRQAAISAAIGKRKEKRKPAAFSEHRKVGDGPCAAGNSEFGIMNSEFSEDRASCVGGDEVQGPTLRAVRERPLRREPTLPRRGG